MDASLFSVYNFIVHVSIYLSCFFFSQLSARKKHHPPRHEIKQYPFMRHLLFRGLKSDGIGLAISINKVNPNAYVVLVHKTSHKGQF